LITSGAKVYNACNGKRVTETVIKVAHIRGRETAAAAAAALADGAAATTYCTVAEGAAAAAAQL
jgi:hypothetical protein